VPTQAVVKPPRTGPRSTGLRGTPVARARRELAIRERFAVSLRPIWSTSPLVPASFLSQPAHTIDADR
jgi:hypothetical protein